ncbi:MAG: PAS domain-containing protein [Candidatus Riflebacteria bacterium]
MSYTTESAFLPDSDSALFASFVKFSRYEFDIDRRVFQFDKNLGPMIGYPSIPVMTQDELYSLMPPGDREHCGMFMQTVQDGIASTLRKELQLKTADGIFKWFAMLGRLKKTGNLHAGPVLEGLVIDISFRRRAVADLSENERWFRDVLEESPHAMYRVDYQNNRFDYISSGFAKALGCKPEEILDKPYTDFMMNIHPDDHAAIRKDLDQLFLQADGKRFTYYCEFRFKLKTGHYVWLEDTFTVVPGPGGQYSYQVGFGSVIEGRKHLEEQLKSANEKLEDKVNARTAELNKANLELRALVNERQELEKRLLEISERERRFIGRELHDGLCQQIVGVQCMFEAIRSRLSKKNADEAEDMRILRDLLHDAVQQTRHLSRGLCPLSLAPEAVGDALATLAAQTGVLHQISCSFDGSLGATINNPEAALHVYRITQEAIQNAIRHGKAKNITISITEKSDRITLRVTNDGKPFKNRKEQEKSAEPGSGLGLKLIDYRVSLLGGKWEMGNHGGKVVLTVNVPRN